MSQLLDARWLAMFMICCTQDGWAAEQLPAGAEPNYRTTPATQMGLREDIQKQFYAAFGHPVSFTAKLADHNRIQPAGQFAMPKASSGKELTPLEVFQLSANLLRLAGGPLYKPPACPNDTTLKAAVTAMNKAADDNS